MEDGLTTSIPGMFARFVDPDDRTDVVLYAVIAYENSTWNALINPGESHLMTIKAYEEDSGMLFTGIVGPPHDLRYAES